MGARIPRKVDDIGQDMIKIVKVPAHVDPDKIPKGEPAWVDAVGNTAADAWAKEGALMHPGISEAKKLGEARKAFLKEERILKIWRFVLSKS